MLQVTVYSLESRGTEAPEQVIAGTIKYDDGKFTHAATADEFENMVAGTLSIEVRLEKSNRRIRSSQEPERWMRSLYLQSGSYIRYSKALNVPK